MSQIQSPIHRDSLADVLERILDKGLVVAGDVSISLVGIELLTIRLRLLVATVDKAKELGINWWETDPHLHRPVTDQVTPPALDGTAAAALEDRIARLESALVEKEVRP